MAQGQRRLRGLRRPARTHLNENLRGVASQTYDVIPIGYPDGGGAAPNWRVVAGQVGRRRRVHRRHQRHRPDRLRRAPARRGQGHASSARCCPQPTEDYFHPYGLQNYAVTYTGYTLLENMLDYRPRAVEGCRSADRRCRRPGVAGVSEGGEGGGSHPARPSWGGHASARAVQARAEMANGPAPSTSLHRLRSWARRCESRRAV